MELILKRYKNHRSESKLEKELDSYIAGKVFEAEAERGSGLDKIIAYFYKKMNCYSNIRLILFSKESGLSIDEVKQNLLPL